MIFSSPLALYFPWVCHHSILITSIKRCDPNDYTEHWEHNITISFHKVADADDMRRGNRLTMSRPIPDIPRLAWAPFVLTELG